MKSAPSALAIFMENATTFFRADLYTFTLPSGLVLRWSGATVPVKASLQVLGTTTGPYEWLVGPPIGDQGVQSARGVAPGSVDVTLNCGDGRFQVGGVDVRDFAFGLGFDGALVRIDRAYAASVSDMTTIGPVGTYCRFSGRMSEPKELGQTQVVLTCTDFRDALDTDYPKATFQTSCNNTFGDAKCGVNLAALTVTGSVTNTGGTQTAATFDTTLTQAGNYFQLGALTFTSGVNSGLSRSVKAYSQQGGGVLMQSPFPSIPQPGDTFSIVPGCLLSMGTSANTCGSWQSAVPSGTPWQQRYRATPFVPPPTTGLPT
jgi:hypothetical protein